MARNQNEKKLVEGRLESSEVFESFGATTVAAKFNPVFIKSSSINLDIIGLYNIAFGQSI
jgi:hypothetical protein